MSGFKQVARRIVVGPGVRRVFRPWTVGRVPILMAHRFLPAGERGSGTPVDLLDACLAFLGREGFRALTLAGLCERLREGEIPSRTICFTVDDGYRDFGDLAFPVLRRHGVPATVFVASDFIHGRMWYWWDRIEHAFARTTRDQLRLPLGVSELALSWTTPRERDLARAAFTEACKKVPNQAKLDALRLLEERLGVELPAEPPPESRGMSWEDLRRLAAAGIEFGAHTVTHPILSRLSDALAEEEVVRSIAEIEASMGVRPRTFAYPNGQSADFTPHVVRVLAREGILGAVVGEPGIVSKRALERRSDPLYRLPRMGMPSSLEEFQQVVSGIEGLIQAVRS